MNVWFLAAAVVAALTAPVHFFVGGKEVARPLLATEALNQRAQVTLYFVWHLVTVTLVGMAVALAVAAFDPAAVSLGVAAALLAAGFVAVNGYTLIRCSVGIPILPQFVFFVPIAVLGFIGSLSAV